MNTETAIKAHVQWKAKLRAYLQAPNKSLNPVEIEKDNNCELGKWLHGEGATHAGKQTYKDLVVEHAKFHKAAADVVRRADSGKKVLEETILGNSSTFSGIGQGRRAHHRLRSRVPLRNPGHRSLHCR